MSSKARAQKAFMYGLLGSCLLGFAAIVLVGVLVEDAPFSIYHRAGGKSPILGFQRRPAPKLEELQKAFKPNECFNGFDLDWTSGANGQIYVNNKPFFLKGESLLLRKEKEKKQRQVEWLEVRLMWQWWGCPLLSPACRCELHWL